MHRVNFAHASGVVVDVCREHGTWFDHSELQRIILFIRSGGFDRARARQLSALAQERRQLENARRESGRESLFETSRCPPADLLRLVVGSTGGVLGRWLRR